MIYFPITPVPLEEASWRSSCRSEVILAAHSMFHLHRTRNCGTLRKDQRSNFPITLVSLEEALRRSTSRPEHTLVTNDANIVYISREILPCTAGSFTGNFTKMDTWAQPTLATCDIFFIYIGQKLKSILHTSNRSSFPITLVQLEEVTRRSTCRPECTLVTIDISIVYISQDVKMNYILWKV